MLKYLLAAALGAVLAYFLDPDRGARRRNIARDRLLAAARRSAGKLEDKAEYASGVARGVAYRAKHLDEQDQAPLDDATLAHKVETELFRNPDVPKGKININAEHGVIKVRGEVQDSQEINTIVERIQRIQGVQGVDNLLHLPGTHVPTTPP